MNKKLSNLKVVVVSKPYLVFALERLKNLCPVL